MIKWSRENWIMLGLAGAVVVVMILAVFIPQGKKLDSIKTSIAARKIALADGTKKAAVVPQMVRKVESMKSRYKDFDRRLPKSKEMGEFLQEITAVRAASELTEARMETGTPVSEELFNTMPIRMRFRGRYLALAELLRRLDGMQRLTRVERLVIKSSGEAPDDLDIELQMNIYFTKS